MDRERLAALPDGSAATLEDGTVVHVGHRRMREGSRIALLQVPGLLRFDVERLGDTFSFSVRNLRGGEQSDGAALEAGTYHPPGRPAVNEYEFGVGWVDGPQVQVVAWLQPYEGALESDCSAFAIVTPS